MNLQPISKVCYLVCIVCVVMGLTLGLEIIWGNAFRDETAGKASATILIFFFAALSVLVATHIYTGIEKNKDEKKEVDHEPEAR